MDKCLADIVYRKGNCVQQIVSMLRCACNVCDKMSDTIEYEIVSTIAEYEQLVIEEFYFDALKTFDIHDIQCDVNGKKLELIST
jgi:hypothetical protein